jgi:hypothetical protein
MKISDEKINIDNKEDQLNQKELNKNKSPGKIFNFSDF